MSEQAFQLIVSAEDVSIGMPKEIPFEKVASRRRDFECAFGNTRLENLVTQRKFHPEEIYCVASGIGLLEFSVTGALSGISQEQLAEWLSNWIAS